MKKGFTLVEILAVFTIIGIIAAISTPIVTNVFKDAKNKAYEEQISLIKDAARSYMASNPSKVKQGVTVETLKDEGFISNKELIDPRNNKNIKGCITVKYENSKYKYEFNENNTCS